MVQARTVVGLAIGVAVFGGGMLGAQAYSAAPGNTSTGQSVVQALEDTADELLEIVGIEEQVAPGTIDDGKDLLPYAVITLGDAIAAAQTAATGSVGEVDLEYFEGTLVFNVDIGDFDVKVDAATGVVLGQGRD